MTVSNLLQAFVIKPRVSLNQPQSGDNIFTIHMDMDGQGSVLNAEVSQCIISGRSLYICAVGSGAYEAKITPLHPAGHQTKSK